MKKLSQGFASIIHETLCPTRNIDGQDALLWPTKDIDGWDAFLYSLVQDLQHELESKGYNIKQPEAPPKSGIEELTCDVHTVMLLWKHPIAQEGWKQLDKSGFRQGSCDRLTLIANSEDPTQPINWTDARSAKKSRISLSVKLLSEADRYRPFKTYGVFVLPSPPRSEADDDHKASSAGHRHSGAGRKGFEGHPDGSEESFKDLELGLD